MFLSPRLGKRRPEALVGNIDKKEVGWRSLDTDRPPSTRRPDGGDPYLCPVGPVSVSSVLSPCPTILRVHCKVDMGPGPDPGSKVDLHHTRHTVDRDWRFCTTRLRRPGIGTVRGRCGRLCRESPSPIVPINQGWKSIFILVTSPWALRVFDTGDSYDMKAHSSLGLFSLG